MRSAAGLLVAPPAPPRGPRRMVCEPPAPDLALLATAAADAWSQGRHIPAPSFRLAYRLGRACRAAGRVHHLTVSDAYAARCHAVLMRLFALLCELPEARRRPTLSGVLLDFLNDRSDPAFAAVSDLLTEVDRELAPTDEDAAHAARIADVIRGEAHHGC